MGPGSGGLTWENGVLVLAWAGLIVYYPYMASIVGKKRGGATYYYLVESARIRGKTRITSDE